MLPVTLARLAYKKLKLKHMKKFLFLNLSGKQIFLTICHLTGNFSIRQFHEKVATVWRLGSNTAGLLINEPKPTFACLMNEHGKRVSEFPSQSETLKL